MFIKSNTLSVIIVIDTLNQKKKHLKDHISIHIKCLEPVSESLKKKKEPFMSITKPPKRRSPIH